MAAPVFVSYILTGSLGSGAQNITKPSGVVEGTMLILKHKSGNTNCVVTPPEGWTTAYSWICSVDRATHTLLWKLATASEPSTYSFSFSISGNQNLMMAWTGTHLTQPIGSFAPDTPVTVGSTQVTQASVGRVLTDQVVVAWLVPYDAIAATGSTAIGDGVLSWTAIHSSGTANKSAYATITSDATMQPFVSLTLIGGPISGFGQSSCMFTINPPEITEYQFRGTTVSSQGSVPRPANANSAIALGWGAGGTPVTATNQEAGATGGGFVAVKYEGLASNASVHYLVAASGGLNNSLTTEATRVGLTSDLSSVNAPYYFASSGRQAQQSGGGYNSTALPDGGVLLATATSPVGTAAQGGGGSRGGSGGSGSGGLAAGVAWTGSAGLAGAAGSGGTGGAGGAINGSGGGLGSPGGNGLSELPRGYNPGGGAGGDGSSATSATKVGGVGQARILFYSAILPAVFDYTAQALTTPAKTLSTLKSFGKTIRYAHIGNANLFSAGLSENLTSFSQAGVLGADDVIANPVNGAVTANSLTMTNTTTGSHQVNFSTQATGGTAEEMLATVSVYLRKNTYSFVSLEVFTWRAIIDLDTGLVTAGTGGNSTTPVSVGAVDAGGGWWRLWVSFVSAPNNGYSAILAFAPSATTFGDTVGNLSSSFYFFGLHHSTGAGPPKPYSTGSFGANTFVASLSALKSYGRTLQVAATIVDTLVKSTGKVITNVTTPAKTLVKQTSRALNALASRATTLVSSKTLNRAYNALSNIAGTLVELPNKLVQATTTPAKTMLRQVGKFVQDVTTPVATAIKAAPKLLQYAATLVNTIGTVFSPGTVTTPKAVEALAAASSTLRRSIGKNIARAVSLVTAFLAQSSKGWVFANSNTSAVQVRVGFPTPSPAPNGNQVITLQARKRGLGSTPSFVIEIMEAASGTVLSSSAPINVTSNTGSLHTHNFDASVLTDVSGVNTEVRVTATPTSESTVEFGYLDWQQNHSTSATEGTFPAASAARTLLRGKVISVIAGAVGTLALIKSLLRSLLATTSPAKTLVRQIGAALRVTNSPSSTLARMVGKGVQWVAAIVASTGTVFASGNQIFNQAVNALSAGSATLRRDMVRILLAVSNQATALTRSTSRSIAKTSALAANLASSKSFLRSLTSTSAGAATLSAIKSFLRTIQALSTHATTLVKTSGKQVISTSAATSSIVRSITRSIASILSVIALRVVTFAHSLNGLAGASTTLAAAKVFLRTIQAVSTSFTSLVKNIGKLMLDTTFPAANLARTQSLFRGLQATSSAAATLLRATPRLLLATVSVVISLLRPLSKNLQVTATGITTRLLAMTRSILVVEAPEASRVSNTTKPVVSVSTVSTALAAFKAFLRSLSATSSAVATILRPTGKSLLSTTAPVSSRLRAMTKAIATATAGVSSRISSIARLIAKVTTPVATLNALKFFLRSLSATSSAVATRVLLTAKSILGTTSPVKSLIRAMTRTLGSVQSPIVTRLNGLFWSIQRTTAPVATLNTLKFFLRTVQALAQGAATRVLQITKSILGTTSPVATRLSIASMARTISAIASTAASRVSSLTKSIAKTTAAVATLAMTKVFLRLFATVSLPASTLSRATAKATTAIVSTSNSLIRSFGKSFTVASAGLATRRSAFTRSLARAVSPVATLVSSSAIKISAVAAGSIASLVNFVSILRKRIRSHFWF